MKRSAIAALVALAGSACAHLGPAPAGPEAIARAYAEALERGDLTAAHALSAGMERAQFQQAYADPAVRSARAALVRQAADGAPGAGALGLVKGADGWRVEEPRPAAPVAFDEAAAALQRFLEASERGDFESALKLLASSWRSRYSAERLKADFAKEPLSKERLQRARAALQAGQWQPLADGAQLVLSEGRAVRLRRETDGYKVVALE